MTLKRGYVYRPGDWRQYKLDPERYGHMLEHDELRLRLEGEVSDMAQLQQLNSFIEQYDEHLDEFNRESQHFCFLHEYRGVLKKEPDEALLVLFERYISEGIELVRGIRALCCQQMRTTLKLPEEDDGALLHNFFIDDRQIIELQRAMGLTWRLGFFLHSVYMINRTDYLMRNPTFYITRIPITPVYCFDYKFNERVKFFPFDLIAGCNMFLDNLQGYERREAATRTVPPQLRESMPEAVQSVSAS
ncbi:MAG: hypothetical protein IJ228_06300 [Succinivibrio sp.]|nr:hypothetical protein [Succinivibrio sp.]